MGLITQRLRVCANEESFEMARNNLVRGVEDCRRQKSVLITVVTLILLIQVASSH